MAFEHLLDIIRNLEPELETEIKRLDQAQIAQSRERIYRYIASRLDEVLKNLPQFERIKAIFATTRLGDTGLQTGKGIAKTTIFGGKVKQRSGKPPAAAGESKRAPRYGYGLSFDEDRFIEEPDLRSRFEPTFGQIVVNNAHPDYVNRVLKATDERQVLDYYYKLAVKEVVLYQYEGAPPRELLERLLDLQLSMETVPPAI